MLHKAYVYIIQSNKHITLRVYGDEIKHIFRSTQLI